MSSARSTTNDLLHLRSTGLRLVFALILMTQIALALEGIGGVRGPVPVIVALIAFSIGLLLVATPHPEKSRWWVIAVLALSVGVNALILWNLPRAGWPAYADWSLGAVAWLCFFLAFRGRILAAWGGWVLMAALTQVWGATIGETPIEALGHVDRHAGIILVAVLFRLLLVRTSREIVALHDERVVQVAAESASLAELRERTTQALRLNEYARPALQQIAQGQYLDEDDQRHYRLLEANLRDLLRGGELARREIATAAESARNRGVDVVLLDDRNAPLSEVEAIRIADALLHELATATHGRVTGRLLPPGREAIASIVTTDDSEHHRVDL